MDKKHMIKKMVPVYQILFSFNRGQKTEQVTSLSTSWTETKKAFEAIENCLKEKCRLNPGRFGLSRMELEKEVTLFLFDEKEKTVVSYKLITKII